jgi:tetratricopeptide (TPR) repeat protein
MRFIYLVFICLILGIMSVYAQDDSRASATWQVQRYDISAELPQSAGRDLTVKALLTLKNVSSSPATSLTLRISPSAAISAVTINGNAADFVKREEKLAGGGTLQRASIRVPSVAPGATLTAGVDYKLTVKENSGLSAISPATSQFLPLSFWYPTPNSWYFARGADHAPFKIRVTAPSGQTVIAAGAESSGSYDQPLNGQPFFIAGYWDATNSNGVSIYLPKSASADEQKRAAEAAALVGDAKAFLTGRLGSGADIPIRLVAARRGAGFSEAGTILIDENAFRRPKLDSLTATNIAEAVARFWIGNSINIVGDGQGVVREGLVRFIATEFLESKYGKEIADAERARQRVAYISVARRDAPLSTISPMDDFYFPAVANKGAMVWRMLARRVGSANFFNAIKANAADGQLDLAELRAAFSEQKDLLDYELDQTTDMNLLVGLPQASGAETKVALRNSGGIDATVSVMASTASGEKIPAQSTIKARDFGEVSFRTPQKIVRVEVDSEKIYPQIDYSDDVAPREFTDSDVLVAVKRFFDKQDFAGAEKAARTALSSSPHNDDVRTLLGRSLLAQARNNEAEKEFTAILNEPLPTARSMAWASVGLAQIAAKNGQNTQAAKLAEDAIRADAEYGATLAARNLRNTLGNAPAPDDSVKAFFAAFDKAAVANRKADIDSMFLPGEAVKFANGMAGQTEQWQTQVLRTDRVNTDTVLAETNLSLKLLNGEPETGLAVFRLTKVGGVWKLSGVDMYEVR